MGYGLGSQKRAHRRWRPPNSSAVREERAQQRRGRAQGPQRLPACRHDGFHSATSRYERQAAVLRFVLVCDSCGSEVREVASLQYRPRFACGPAASFAA
jgi:hypothetical protein